MFDNFASPISMIVIKYLMKFINNVSFCVKKTTLLKNSSS